ncbi:NADH-quinone oxidoreductase subunit N [Modicisalibacter radicis]|uniref:NADH-quinone oxidoreductase subunit N n=1 Tax=Halomonas sp. EAR18 TaxID=2518972 RepID=UPI00109CB843|nr:NADH-quinone oxidoreductase subunit N [Halomonas sp. EAR18]
MPVGDLIPELILLAAAVAIVLFASFAAQRHQAWAAGLALAALVAAGVASVAQWGPAPQLSFAGVWALDRPAIVAKLVILVSGAVCIGLSPDWLRGDRRHGEYYALCLFTLLGALMMAAAHDTMELMVGVLLTSVASYPLAAFHRGWAPALEAAMKYYLIGALTNALLALGVVLLFGLVGDTGYAATAAALAGADPWGVIVAVACVVIGLSFKLAAFPGHAWLPDVAQAAPAPAAALLTVVPKVGAALALARFVALLPDAVAWPAIVALIAAVTMTLGNLAALRQHDLRRLLGWSSVSQSGYALMAIVVLDAAPRALPALLVFLVAYALANLAAFAVVTHWRGRTAFDDCRGLGHSRPLTSAVLIVALLSLVGIPPLVGFVGKLLLFEVTIAGGYVWLAVLAVVNTVISLYYYLRVAATLLFHSPKGEIAVLGRFSGWTLTLTAALLGVVSLVVQVLLAPLTGIAFAAA